MELWRQIGVGLVLLALIYYIYLSYQVNGIEISDMSAPISSLPTVTDLPDASSVPVLSILPALSYAESKTNKSDRSEHKNYILSSVPCGPKYTGPLIGKFDQNKYCIVPHGSLDDACNQTPGCAGYSTSRDPGWNAAYPNAGMLGQSPAIANDQWDSYY